MALTNPYQPTDSEMAKLPFRFRFLARFRILTCSAILASLVFIAASTFQFSWYASRIGFFSSVLFDDAVGFLAFNSASIGLIFIVALLESRCILRWNRRHYAIACVYWIAAFVLLAGLIQVDYQWICLLRDNWKNMF